MRRFLAAAAVSAVAFTVLPAVAHADAGPVVNYAHSVNEDLGTLEVAAHADAGIASLKAYIVSYATGQDVAVVDNLALYSGTVNDGVWRTPDTLKLPEYRNYRIDVEATDAAGAHADRRQAGDLAYYIKTNLTLTAPSTQVTYTRRSVRAMGTLTGRWPDTREVKPIAGEKIDVDNVWGGFSGTPTTGKDGSYAVTVPMDTDAFSDGFGTVEATFQAQGPYLRGGTVDLRITIDPAKSRITAQVTPRRVDKGGSVTISGQLTWRSPDQGWQPLANAPVGALFCVTADYCPTDGGRATTDANGRYEITNVPWQTGHYQVGGGVDDIFIADASTNAAVVVYQPETFADFTVNRDAAGAATAAGHLRFENFTPGTIPVEIQYRARGTSAWTTVATVPNAQWDSTGYFFSATVANQPVGNWRAYYPGLENQFRPLYSAVVVK